MAHWQGRIIWYNRPWESIIPYIERGRMTKTRTYYLSDKQSESLKNMAKGKGCIVQRGPGAGQGSVDKLMQALADGRLIVVKLK